jgi:hypothetical protein
MACELPRSLDQVYNVLDQVLIYVVIVAVVHAVDFIDASQMSLRTKPV